MFTFWLTICFGYDNIKLLKEKEMATKVDVKKKAVFEFIKKQITEKGYPPSVRELIFSSFMISRTEGG